MRHGQGGERGPGRGDGGGLGHQGEVHLDLPALVDLRGAAVPTRAPRAVGDADQVGAAENIVTFVKPESKVRIPKKVPGLFKLVCSQLGS